MPNRQFPFMSPATGATALFSFLVCSSILDNTKNLLVMACTNFRSQGFCYILAMFPTDIRGKRRMRTMKQRSLFTYLHPIFKRASLFISLPSYWAKAAWTPICLFCIFACYLSLSNRIYQLENQLRLSLHC